MTALIYSAIIVTLAIGVSIFLMTVVMPMLLENLIESGKPLPWPTKVLQTMSNLLVEQGIWLLLGTLLKRFSFSRLCPIMFRTGNAPAMAISCQ